MEKGGGGRVGRKTDEGTHESGWGWVVEGGEIPRETLKNGDGTQR